MTHYALNLPAVVSFSGGSTSGYLLRKVLDAFGGQPELLRICFQNTGLEHPKTLDFIHECETRWDCRIDWLEYDLSLENNHSTTKVDYKTASRNGEPFSLLIEKMGYLPNPVARFCTANLKVRTLDRFLKALPGFEEGWENAIGLRADEPHRVHRLKPDSPRDSPIFPLYRAEIGKREIETWWQEQPFRLELPLGGNIAGNCVGCFLKSAPRLDTLAREMPEHFKWWIEAEKIELKSKGAGGRFRNDRPGYATLVKSAKEQPLLFDPNAQDDSLPCFCSD